MLAQRFLTAFAAVIAAIFLIAPALAGSGQPSPWQLGFQQSATPVMDNITWFHDFLLYVITAITVFVLALLLIIIVRFNAKANPVPSRTTHHTLLEVAWTVIPVIILLGLVIPSFKLLFLQLNIPQADITIKATGKQWFWTYTYPDHGKFEFDSLMVQEKDHAFMPIAVRVVKDADFAAWVEQAKKKFARGEDDPVAVAANAATKAQ